MYIFFYQFAVLFFETIRFDDLNQTSRTVLFNQIPRTSRIEEITNKFTKK